MANWESITHLLCQTRSTAHLSEKKEIDSTTSTHGSNFYIIIYQYRCNLAPSELLKINDVFSYVDGNMILSQIPTHADSGSSILSRAISNVHKFQQNQQFLSRMTGISFPSSGLRNFPNISRFLSPLHSPLPLFPVG